MPKADVAVVGGGIIGLAQAYFAAGRGWSVLLFERHEFARGASIRNFGMIWPIGQTAGERLQLALRSRVIWGEVAKEAGIRIGSTGSVHLAYRDDEADVIREFAEIGPLQPAQKTPVYCSSLRIKHMFSAQLPLRAESSLSSAGPLL
jgi:glycine/D-amino acid oxidase-like deaminating enzyme